MELINNKYIILELIPTALTPERGDIIQLSALKIDGIKLLDRFDYRLNEEKISNPSFLELIEYDKNQFTYKNTTKEIVDDFVTWSSNLPILILDNVYTNNFLQSIPNPIESIATYFNMEYDDTIVEQLINKFNLEPSNYIVDLLYESLIKML